MCRAIASLFVLQFAICQVAYANKCYVNALGFYLQAEVVPGLKGDSYFLHVNCDGRAALTVKSPGKPPVRKEWNYSFREVGSLIDAVTSASFYDLPTQIGDVLPPPDSGAYMLNIHRDLERHRVVYSPGFNVPSGTKFRFTQVWNAAFGPSGIVPQIP
jgi:hypothetical protein